MCAADERQADRDREGGLRLVKARARVCVCLFVLAWVRDSEGERRGCARVSGVCVTEAERGGAGARVCKRETVCVKN